MLLAEHGSKNAQWKTSVTVELGVELGCSGDSRHKEEKRADKCCQWSQQHQEGGG